jgi:hypothetical protein
MAALMLTTVAVFIAALVSQFLGWETTRSVILIVWVANVFAVAMTRGMRWTAVLTYLSVLALVGGFVLGELAGWSAVNTWVPLVWAALLVPVAIALFSHPMRVPALGLFVGFWGVVGVLGLIAIQLVAGGSGLAGPASIGWLGSVPIGLVGIWLLVASSLGYGAERFPRWVDVLGLLSLLAICITFLINPEDAPPAGLAVFAVVGYCLWALGFGWVLWGTQDVSHRFGGLSPKTSRLNQA